MEKSLAEEFNNFLADLRNSHRDTDLYPAVEAASKYLFTVKNMEYCVAALVLEFEEDIQREGWEKVAVFTACGFRPIYKRALNFLVRESTEKLINL